MKRYTINRITFLVHPYCYAESLREALAAEFPQWEDYHNHELEVAQRWYAAIDAMGEQDAVVYHPCRQSEEEKALAAHGKRRLNERFITLGGTFLKLYTPEILAAIAADIDEAFRTRGKYNWYAHDLRVAAFSYAYARDILSLFRERGISFEPSVTALRTMGESWEGCANNWTTMLPSYLGIPKRVEMPYELSVPDTHFLLECRHEKRIELPFDTALHLFTDREGHPIVLYVRERVRLADVSYYAALDVDWNRISIRIRDGSLIFSSGTKLSDKVPPSFIRKGSRGNPEIMVASGRWRGGDEAPYAGRESHLFVTASTVGPEAFFAAAEKAEIVPEK